MTWLSRRVRALRSRGKATAAVLFCALPLALAGCETAPATGESFFTGGMSAEREREVGAQEHERILAQFGGAYEEDPQLTRYVESIGNLLAQTSELPNIQWTFTIIDSPIVNAFALPGGYVYVTRGLIALAQNEAELAGVMAHEIGHVTARHSAQRYGSSVLATAAGVAAALLLGDVAGQMTGQASQLALLSYSREQEFQADTLGVRYLSRAGYDPQAMASFLGHLQASSQLEAQLRNQPGAADDFSLLQTHPRTTDRIQRAIETAGVTQVPNPMLARDVYLEQIGGIMYGDNPREGVIHDRTFIHPDLRLSFEVPEGFRLINGAQQVTALGPQDAVIVFDADGRPAGSDILGYLNQRWGQGISLQGVERLEINGMAAATGQARVETQQGPRDARLIAIAYDSQRVYRFLFLTPPGMTPSLAEPLQRTTYSFRKLSDEEAEGVQPLRIQIREVRQGETVASLAQSYPYADYREERFRLLNGLVPGEEVQPGQKVKMVVR